MYSERKLVQKPSVSSHTDWIGDPSETRRVEMKLAINVGRAVCNIEYWLNDIVEKEFNMLIVPRL